MKRLRTFVLCAGVLVLVLVPILAGVMPGPTRVGPPEAMPASPVQSLTLENPRPLAPTLVQYAPPGSGATAEIISRAGEILGAISNPDRRSELAEQWLRFSKDTIAKDQQFRNDWLQVQKQQLAQQEEAGQLHLQIAQLQLQMEQLRAQNLQLQQQLAQAHGGQAPAGSLPTPPSQ